MKATITERIIAVLILAATMFLTFFIEHDTYGRLAATSVSVYLGAVLYKLSLTGDKVEMPKV